MSGMGISVWYSLMAPAGTPRSIVDRLDSELARLNRDPAVQARLKQAEFQPFGLDAAQFRPFFSDELAFWRRFVVDSAR